MWRSAIFIFSLEKCQPYSMFIFKYGFFWLLSCRSSLYILIINSLSDIYFSNIFSNSVGLFTVYYSERQGFNFNEVQFIYSFMLLMFLFLILKTLPNPRSYSCTSWLKQNYGFTLRFQHLIHFEFISVRFQFIFYL